MFLGSNLRFLKCFGGRNLMFFNGFWWFSSVWGGKVKISYRFSMVFGVSPRRTQGELDDLELKFYLSMGSKSHDFLKGFKSFLVDKFSSRKHNVN